MSRKKLNSHKCHVSSKGVIQERYGKIVYVVSVNTPKIGDKIINYFEYSTKDEADEVLKRHRESLMIENNNLIKEY